MPLDVAAASRDVVGARPAEDVVTAVAGQGVITVAGSHEESEGGGAQCTALRRVEVAVVPSAGRPGLTLDAPDALDAADAPRRSGYLDTRSKATIEGPPLWKPL